MVARTNVGENSEKNGLVFSQNIMLSRIKSYAREIVIYDNQHNVNFLRGNTRRNVVLKNATNLYHHLTHGKYLASAQIVGKT